MNSQYFLRGDVGESCAFTNRETNITLQVQPFRHDSDDLVTFMVPVDPANPLNRIEVTSTNMRRYPQEVQDLVQRPRGFPQYLEVGAGLGELAVAAASAYARAEIQKLKIIDLANPADMQELGLRFLSQFRQDVDPTVRCRIEELVRRCEVLLSDKVEFIRMPLEEVLQRRPDLTAVADVVIDHYATCHSQDLQIEDTLHALHHCNGRLLRYGHDKLVV